MIGSLVGCVLHSLEDHRRVPIRRSHSALPLALNTKMRHPRDLIDAAVAAYEADRVDIAACEGFVRQILGWREYMRGIYWSRIPDYAKSNALCASRPLPRW